MPQLQNNNPQEEAQELELDEQLDAVLAQLKEVEPDLLAAAGLQAPASVAEPPSEDVAPIQSATPSVVDEAAAPSQPAADVPVTDSTDSDSPDELPLAATVQAPDQETAEETVGQVDEQFSSQTEEALDEILDRVVADDAEPEPVQDEAGPPEPDLTQEVASAGEADHAEQAGSLADQLQQLLAGEEVAEAEAESQATAEVAAEAGGEASQGAQLDLQAKSEPIEVAPVAGAVVDEGPTRQLSMEEIDQLLADEASSEGNEMDGLVESPAAEPASPEAALSPAVEAPVGGVDSAQAAAVEPDLDHTTGGGGFDADAQAVARELDEQTHIDPAGAAVVEVSIEDFASRSKRRGFKLNKEMLVGVAAKCERGLRRVCTWISRPVLNSPAWVRDAIGFAAILPLLVGFVLIVGKLLGAL